ncbi:hypothetical protein AABB24_034118 [Solanum stoloniferum]|uniref:Reverse transcriptase zinc-binding domain-containing protein n=1 Tax=Solanum stoloniferum TaxID=62892 RepID=A0ABD2RE39_9SOLN
MYCGLNRYMGLYEGASYASMLGVQSKLRIAGLIWNKISQPRHIFIVWLAVQGRLLTKDRLQRMNIPVDTITCSLCDAQAVETQYHLFSVCDWTKRLVTTMAQWTGVQIPSGDVKQVLNRIRRRHWKQLYKEIIAALWGSIVYYVWQARNWKLYRGTVQGHYCDYRYNNYTDQTKFLC